MRFLKYLKEEISTCSVSTPGNFNDLVPDEKKGLKKKIQKRGLLETDSSNIAYIPFHYGSGGEDEIDTDSHDNILGVHDKKHIIGKKSKKAVK